MPLIIFTIKQKIFTFFRNTKESICNRSNGYQMFEFGESALVSNKEVHQSYSESVVSHIVI
jgi:hypothetical protein